jgi:hypothetical protein
MIKCIYLFIGLFLSQELLSQGQTLDAFSVKQKREHFVNFGNSLSIGGEYMPLNPNQYGGNLNYRFWYRSGNRKRVTDNIINLSVGYLRLINKDILKLKVGDLILIKGKFRLGVFADYFVGNETKIMALDCHLGYLTDRFYFYIGGIQPLVNWKNGNEIKSNISLGFDFYIFNQKVYIN